MVEVEVTRKASEDEPPRPRPPARHDGCGWLLVRWLIAAAVVFGTARLLEPHVAVDSFGRAMIVAAVLGVLNTIVRPIMIVLTLPITVLTLGLFLLVINALLIIFAGWLLDGFHVESFGWALLAGLIISIVNALVNHFLKGERRAGTPGGR